MGAMTMETRESMPRVPDGKVRLWDFASGPLPDGLGATVTALETATAATHSYPTATLAHETRGYVAAGSCMRWQEENWSVLYWLPDGTRHGQRFLNEAAARDYFANLCAPAKVAARKADDAHLEATVYGPAREERTWQQAARKAEERARKSAPRKARKAAKAAA